MSFAFGLAPLGFVIALGGDTVPSPLAALADAPVEVAFEAAELEPVAAPLQVVAPAPTLSRKRLRSGIAGTLVGASLFATASAATWILAETGGALDDARNPDSRFHPVAMAWGGAGTVAGALTMGLAGESFGKALPEDRQALGTRLLSAGAALSIVGAAGMFSFGILFPMVDDACPIGMGCTLAGLQGSALLASAGLGMATFGGELRTRTRPRMDRKLRKSWITGSLLAGLGYLGGVAGGVFVWQADPDSPSRRRARNGMLVPVAGPFIVAGSPDVPLLFAGFAALSGALQLGGAITLGVSAGITARKRRGERSPMVRDVVVAPTGSGISVSGRF